MCCCSTFSNLTHASEVLLPRFIQLRRLTWSWTAAAQALRPFSPRALSLMSSFCSFNLAAASDRILKVASASASGRPTVWQNPPAYSGGHKLVLRSNKWTFVPLDNKTRPSILRLHILGKDKHFKQQKKLLRLALHPHSRLVTSHQYIYKMRQCVTHLPLRQIYPHLSGCPSEPQMPWPQSLQSCPAWPRSFWCWAWSVQQQQVCQRATLNFMMPTRFLN